MRSVALWDSWAPVPAYSGHADAAICGSGAEELRSKKAFILIAFVRIKTHDPNMFVVFIGVTVLSLLVCLRRLLLTTVPVRICSSVSMSPYCALYAAL